MFGAIAGAIGSNLVGGLMDNVMGGNGGGLLQGLGDMAQHFLDPLGLFSGEQNAADESSGELKEMIESLQEMVKELMSMLEGSGLDGAAESTAAQPTNISTGSGDDVVTIGGEQNAADETSGELKEMIESLQGMVKELMSMLEGSGLDGAAESTAAQPIEISTGSGDDVVTIG